MTPDEINAVKKAAAIMRKQESMQDEIIEMARQVGMYGLVEGGLIEEFEAFFKLVAAKEREAIKLLAEKELLNTAALMSMPPQSSAAWNILQAIQARGEA